MSTKLRVTEIFESIQGESSLQGLRTVFVRLAGCSLKCNYCDTYYSQNKDVGELFEAHEILEKIKPFDAKYVLVTGGEPLEHPNVHYLLKRLCEEGYSTSLETNGEESLEKVDGRVKIIMDVKTPGSGVFAKNFKNNIKNLKAIDEIKFVITSKEDFEWSKILIEKEISRFFKGEILFSPFSRGSSFDNEFAANLCKWIVDSKLNVRLNVQLHKVIWGNKRGV